MVTLLFVLAMAPPTHYDYPGIRYLRGISPAHMRAWERARDELGTSSLQEVA